LPMEPVRVSKGKMELRLWRYGFIIIRGEKNSYYHIYIGYKNDKGETTPLGKISFPKSSLKTPDDIAAKIAGLGDRFLSTHARDVTDAILNRVSTWKELLIKKELDDLLSVPLLRGDMTSWWDNAGGTADFFAGGTNSDVEKVITGDFRFEGILSYISSNFSEKIAELLEIVMSAGITLKQIDRSRGLINNRPVWCAVVADPSTYKTSTLNLIGDSKYAIMMQNFTPASLLPAKTDVPPLITAMNGKVFIIPTLSEETADEEMARKVFSALEAVYDGHYIKSTGLSGVRDEYVDTVVIAAVTPAVWEWVLPYIVNIGSRWLVYRYELSEDEALKIQERLEENKRNWLTLRNVVSKYFDFLMDNVRPEDLDSVIVPQENPNYDEDLKILAKLVARLRAVWKIETYWEEDEESGKRRPIKEVEVLQVEAPGRAFQQLKNFVRANTLLRKSSVEKIVGLPVVDEHAMKLAARLAIGSTTNKLRELILCIARKQVAGEGVSFRELASNLGLSKSTVERLLKVLRHPKVDLIDEVNCVKEPFFTVIKKYILGDGVEGST